MSVTLQIYVFGGTALALFLVMCWRVWRAIVAHAREANKGRKWVSNRE